MKSKILAFVVLLAVSFSLSSCLDSNDNVTIEYSHDTAITAFSLGTLNRTYKGISDKTKKDTTYNVEFSGASYKFAIDQVARKIVNIDSLPVGTKTNAVLVNITAKSSAPMAWVNKDKDGKDSLSSYSSTDSVDFSKPRQIRVYAADFSAYSVYSVSVNVHKEAADSFVWRSLALQNAELAALTDLKVVSAGNQIFVLGKASDGLKIYKTGNTDGTTWSLVTPNVEIGENAYKSAITKDGVLYVLSNGTVLKSLDGKTWESVAQDASLEQLIGASSQYLYAYNSGKGISVSKDNGATWTEEALDADATQLPAKNLSLTVAPIRSTKNAENLLLVGNRDNSLLQTPDVSATLWTRTVDYTPGAEEGNWNYVEYDAIQKDKLPYLNSMQVAANDSGYVALGAGLMDSAYEAIWYVSKNGIDWKKDEGVAAPMPFFPMKPAVMVRDENNYYWVINNGNVWKGRYNRDGWKKD